MRIVSKIALSIAVASSIFFAGCSNTVSEESLGLRKTDLYSETKETVGEETKYGVATAGTSKTISRAFQDAPPMIPHDVEGMLPITIKDNQCVSCHSPEVAPSMGALAYPISHMTDFRPKTAMARDGRISKDGKAVDNTSNSKLGNVSIKSTNGKLAGARFNCSQCHAPQSQVEPLVANTFQADFTSKDGASKSSWQGTTLMDGINTLAD